MPVTKCTYLFQAGTVDKDGNAARVGGFSETFYAPDTFDSTALASRSIRLCQLRAGLMPKNVRIIGSRFQTVDPVGPSLSFDNVYVGSSTAQNDLPSVALQWTVRGRNTSNQRSLILRGMPDARVVTGEYNPSDAFNAALIAYFQELRGYWTFRAITRTILPVKIVSITADGLLTTQTPHGLAATNIASVMSTHIDDQPNRSYMAYVVTAPTATTAVLQPAGRGEHFTASHGGRVRRAAIIYPGFSITDQEILNPNAITKKVGAPFRKFRGRRTARKS